MLIKTTVMKKMIRFENQKYRLTYTLLSEDDVRYGIKVTCRYGNVIESENIWLGENRKNALKILYLFAKETVFPVALRETYENL